MTEIFRLTDERALEALAHPLRWRLLALLRADGPATATRLAERVQESSGLTSYHLRKLAEVGLVEEDRDRGTRRERWWRAVHEVTNWSPADFLGNPAARQASVAWRREVYRWQWRLIEQWLAEEADWDKPGSDRLVDAMVAWGDADTLRGRLGEMLTAGADHVAIIPVTPDGHTVHLPVLEDLAS